MGEIHGNLKHWVEAAASLTGERSQIPACPNAQGCLAGRQGSFWPQGQKMDSQ